MRALVTGAKGLIGSHMAQFLEDRLYEVKRVDIEQDLRVWSNAYDVTKGIDEVYHFAADVGGIGYLKDPKNKQRLMENTLINWNVLKAASLNKVKRIFLASSSCVYTDNHNEDETYPADCENMYGWEKLHLEHMAQAFPEINPRIGRFQNIYGPNCHWNDGRDMALPALCRKVLEAEKEIEVWGDGLQMRNWLYVGDCVKAVYELTQSDYDQPLNIGSDQSVSISELAKTVIGISGKDIKIKYVSGPEGQKFKFCNNRLRNEVLKWRPSVSLDEGIRQTYEWIRSQL